MSYIYEHHTNTVSIFIKNGVQHWSRKRLSWVWGDIIKKNELWVKFSDALLQILGFTSSCNALKSSLLRRRWPKTSADEQQKHLWMMNSRNLLRHQRLCCWNLESGSHLALLHPCNKLRLVTLNFKSVPLDCCISCLLQNFRQAPMANCIIANRCEWWGLARTRSLWLDAEYPCGVESWVLGCALYLGLGHVKPPQVGVFFLDSHACTWFTCMWVDFREEGNNSTNTGKLADAFSVSSNLHNVLTIYKTSTDSRASL